MVHRLAVQPLRPDVGVTGCAAVVRCLPFVGRMAHRAVVFDARRDRRLGVGVAHRARRYVRCAEIVSGVAHYAVLFGGQCGRAGNFRMASRASCRRIHRPSVVCVAITARCMRPGVKLLRYVAVTGHAIEPRRPCMRRVAVRAVGFERTRRSASGGDRLRVASFARLRHGRIPLVV